MYDFIKTNGTVRSGHVNVCKLGLIIEIYFIFIYEWIKISKRESYVWRYFSLKDSDTTERLHFHFSLSCIGEGNGNPLQCSCLENPRDGGAWWAAVYGVADSWTRLKWLSSSSRQTGYVEKVNCFIELAHVTVQAGKSKPAGGAGRLETQGRIRIPRTCWQNSPSLKKASLFFFFKAVSWLNKAHHGYGEQPALLKIYWFKLNVNPIQKIPSLEITNMVFPCIWIPS